MTQGLVLAKILLVLGTPHVSATDTRPSNHPLLAPIISTQGFSCSPRKTCGQMRSCKEACFYLITCGDRRHDGDSDGIPCENICSRRC